MEQGTSGGGSNYVPKANTGSTRSIRKYETSQVRSTRKIAAGPGGEACLDKQFALETPLQQVREGGGVRFFPKFGGGGN